MPIVSAHFRSLSLFRSVYKYPYLLTVLSYTPWSRSVRKHNTNLLYNCNCSETEAVHTVFWQVKSNHTKTEKAAHTCGLVLLDHPTHNSAPQGCPITSHPRHHNWFPVRSPPVSVFSATRRCRSVSHNAPFLRPRGARSSPGRSPLHSRAYLQLLI